MFKNDCEGIMDNQEFKFLGNSMENISIKYGIFLVMWSALVSWISGSESLTSWIPAMIGFPIFIFGWLTRLKPSQKKLFMHCAVTFGLLAFIGGLDFLRGLFSDGGAFSNPFAGGSKLVLLVSGGLFCFLCIKSFRHTRKIKNSLEMQ